MKLKQLIILYLFFVYSCSNDDLINENICRLSSFQSVQLFYEYLEFDRFGAVNQFSQDFEGISLVYDNQNRIVRVNGGPLAIPFGMNGRDWMMSNDIVYNISYMGNTVTTSSPVTSFYGETTNEYIISDSKINSRSVILFEALIYNLVHFTYQYDDDMVFEYKNNQLHRTFYFENNNLVKVEELVYYNFGNSSDEPGLLFGKFEIIFSEFDDLPNPLEGKFFIDGAFFKAFSKNNYNKLERFQYVFNQETQSFEFYNIINWRAFNFGIHTDGSSGLFQTDCTN